MSSDWNSNIGGKYGEKITVFDKLLFTFVASKEKINKVKNQVRKEILNTNPVWVFVKLFLFFFFVFFRNRFHFMHWITLIDDRSIPQQQEMQIIVFDWKICEKSQRFGWQIYALNTPFQGDNNQLYIVQKFSVHRI